MPTPYQPLTPVQISIATSLVRNPRWSWGSPTTAVRPDGGLVDVMPGRPVAMNPQGAAPLLPLLPDPGVVGHLLGLLETACGEEVTWSVGRRAGGPWWCRLERGAHARSWEGTCLGEAVGAALEARWAALSRPAAPRAGAAARAR